MIPLRDNIPSSTVPFVTYLLISANVGVAIYQASLGPAAEHFVYAWGLVPRLFVGGLGSGTATLITSMFLHGNWMHLIGNMLYLHIFGDNVEDRLGHLRFLAMYMATGALAGMAQVVFDPGSPVPIVGASGAIAGVTGAYFFMFPRARIVTLVPIFMFLQVVHIPAVFFLLFWFVFQLMSGIGSIGAESAGGVAFWAHIGGFLSGMALGPVMARRARRKPASRLRQGPGWL